MFIKIFHPTLGPQKTRLTADVAVAASSSTVENNDGIATNDLFVFGRLGQEKTEIVTITSATSNTTIGHTGGLKFSHVANTPLFEIKYNQAEISRATSEGGAYSVLATISLTPDEDYTIYDDTTGTTASWYKTRYYNSVAATYSTYSATVEGSDYEDESLHAMVNDVLEELGDENATQTSRKRVKKLLNASARKVAREVIKQYPEFLKAYTTQALSATEAYNLPTRFLGFSRIDINFEGSSADDAVKVTQFSKESSLEPGEDFLTSDPVVSFRGTQYIIRPTPTTGYAFLWYWQAPESMSDEDDTHGLPYGAREVLVLYTLYRIWIDRNIEIARDYKSTFGSELGDYIEFVAQQLQLVSRKRVSITSGSDLYDNDE